jgi:hypothetical protein
MPAQFILYGAGLARRTRLSEAPYEALERPYLAVAVFGPSPLAVLGAIDRSILVWPSFKPAPLLSATHLFRSSPSVLTPFLTGLSLSRP